eukprot:13809750-Alexandrium_andersonii.AAC.1
MSASLVGSEMCIRDRLGRPSTPGLAAPNGAVRCRRQAAIDWRLGGRSGPVSYTHLTLPTIC